MSVMNKYLKFLNDSAFRFEILLSKGMFDHLSDEDFLKKAYRIRMGGSLNLKNPQSFNEKLQWLKLYDRRPEYTTMVDKYAVKKYVADRIGEQYIIPTIGVWERFEDIDFDMLPSQFVLKCTHDSGGLAICRDKSKFDIESAKKKINRSLKRNYYYSGREWPYKNVPRKIIAEQFMEDKNSKYLKDYKFFCFDGEVKFLYLSEGLDNHATAHISYVTLDWKQAPFYRNDYKPFDVLPPKPVNFDKMIQLAEVLSKDIPFVRVDFYEINEKVYFGELTFFTGSGFTKFIPNEWDSKLGEYIRLPEKKV